MNTRFVAWAAFVILGGEGGTTVDPTNLSTISASFNGDFHYCVTSAEFKFPGCPVDAMPNGTCRSKNSRWALTRK